MGNTIQNRLKELIKHSEMSQNKFAIETNINKSTVSKMVNGTNFGIEELLKIVSRFPNVSAEWLLRGKGDMILREEASPATSQELEQSYKDTIQELKKENTWLKEHTQDLTSILKSVNQMATDMDINKPTKKPPIKQGRKQKNIA